MASNDISLTPSDVSNQTVPRIAKPPNYIDGGSEEEEDDFDEPRPPPDEHSSTKVGHQRETEPAKQIDANEGVVNGDGIESSARAVDNAVHLNNDTLHDGDGDKKHPPGKKTKEGEVDKGEKVVRNDDPEGEKKGARKGGDKSRDRQDPLALLNKEGEKSKDMSDGNFDADNVTELVDRLESAVDSMSKDEPGAFDALVATLSVFLPMTLFMADEVKMLRDSKKDLLVRYRTLAKENQQARLEAEQRTIVETKSVGTTVKNDEKTANCENCTEEKPEVEDPNKQLELEALKKDFKKLRMQCKELQHVNLSWEKYSTKKSSRHAAEVRKMTEKLATSEEKARKLEKRLEEKFRKYDQTLMEMKHSEERHKLVASEYKKERDVLRMKYDELKRQVKEQEEEIKRLNEVIARKGTAKLYLKPAALVVTQQAHIEEKYNNVPRRKPERTEKQGTATAAPQAANAVEPPAHREKSKAKDGKPSPPLSPRRPPGYMKASSPMSLTRDELKDQVVLYKEQIDVFRADFNQERHDREKAVGQVDSLKKELDKTKKKVKEMQRQRMQEEHDLYVAARVGGHALFLPEDTQEMRLREIKQQAHGKRTNTAHGRKYVEDNLEGTLDLPENHFYAEIN